MKKIVLFLSIFFFCYSISFAMSNPASDYCVGKGGTLTFKTDKEGSSYGVCSFSDGQSCEEWAFFRGECIINNATETKKADSMMMCTMQYAPVCAEKQVQCIKAPCNPIKQTYGNSCQANADNAKTIYNGECLDAKIETKINNSLDNYFSKISQENLQTAKDKLNTKIDLLMQKSRLTSFASQVMNYMKYYLYK